MQILINIKQKYLAYGVVLCLGFLYMPLALCQGMFLDMSYHSTLFEDNQIDSVETYLKGYKDNVYKKIMTLQVDHAERTIVQKNHQNVRANRTWQMKQKFDAVGDRIAYENYNERGRLLSRGRIFFQSQDSICWNYFTTHSEVAFDSSHSCDFKDKHGNIIRRSSTLFADGVGKTSRFFNEYIYDQQGRPLTAEQYRYTNDDTSEAPLTKELTYVTNYAYQENYTRIEYLDVYQDKKRTTEEFYKKGRLVKKMDTQQQFKITKKYFYKKGQVKRIRERSNSVINNSETKFVYYRS